MSLLTNRQHPSVSIDFVGHFLCTFCLLVFLFCYSCLMIKWVKSKWLDREKRWNSFPLYHNISPSAHLTPSTTFIRIQFNFFSIAVTWNTYFLDCTYLSITIFYIFVNRHHHLKRSFWRCVFDVVHNILNYWWRWFRTSWWLLRWWANPRTRTPL